jgi:hypothetical protein
MSPVELGLLVFLAAVVLALRPLVGSRLLTPAAHGVLGALFLALGGALSLCLVGASFARPAFAQESAPGAGQAAESASEPQLPQAPNLQSPQPRTHDERDFFSPASDLALSDERTVIYPENRPAWVNAPRNWEGSLQTSAVCSGPYSTEADARRELNAKITAEVDEYIEQFVGSSLAPTLLKLKLGDVKAQLVRPDNLYQEKIQVSIGPMHQAHAQLEFGPDFRELLERRWNEVKGVSRLAEFGLIGGAVLGLLSVVFGYFRLDTMTRGFYTARLQFGTAAAILSIVVAGAVAARWIPWL